MKRELNEHVIVVTGASSGLGARMTRAFVNRGATVVCASRTEETLRRFVESIEGPGEATYVATDVGSWTDAKRLASYAVEAYGQVDTLVNNAGVIDRDLLDGGQPSVVDLPVDIWETIVRTNLTGAFFCTKAVLPTMIEADSGRIIHMSSGMGLEGRANRSAYAASKFGLEGFHESLAAELDGTGVDSLVLEPGGGVDTDGFSSGMSAAERSERMDPEIIVDPAVRLVAGHGENGGRYVATEEF